MGSRKSFGHKNAKRTTPRAKIALAGVLAAGTLIPAATAFAAPGTTKHADVAGIQQRLDKGLAARQALLSKLTTSVQGDKHLSQPNQTALAALLAQETLGIAGLVKQVPSDTTAAALRTDAKAMVTNYRVYKIVAPQVRMVEEAGSQSAIEGRMIAAEVKLQAAAGTSGAATYSDFVAKVNSASTSTGAVNVPGLVALTPAGYTSSSGVLASAKSSLDAARTDLKAAAADVRLIRGNRQGHHKRAANQPSSTAPSSAEATAG